MIVSACSECIRTDQTSLPILFLIVVREFSTSRCLTGTLQTDEHYNAGFSFYWLVGFNARIDLTTPKGGIKRFICVITKSNTDKYDQTLAQK